MQYAIEIGSNCKFSFKFHKVVQKHTQPKVRWSILMFVYRISLEI